MSPPSGRRITLKYHELISTRYDSKNMSHAIWCPRSCPNPQVKVTRGQAFLTMGHTIRPSPAQVQAHIQLKTQLKGKGKAEDVPSLKSNVELLPEEALYLLERGSLQIWKGDDEIEFDDEQQVFPGMTEITAMEAFARLIGTDGLSLERYQVSRRGDHHRRARAGCSVG